MKNDEIWLAELIKRLEDDLEKAGNQGHVIVFEGSGLDYSQSNLVVQAELYRGLDVKLMEVIGFQYRGKWLRALRPGRELTIDIDKRLKIDLDDVRAGDKLRIIVFARSDSELPSPTALRFDVPR